jgi:hypothetical protein
MPPLHLTCHAAVHVAWPFLTVSFRASGPVSAPEPAIASPSGTASWWRVPLACSFAGNCLRAALILLNCATRSTRWKFRFTLVKGDLRRQRGLSLCLLPFLSPGQAIGPLYLWRPFSAFSLSKPLAAKRAALAIISCLRRAISFHSCARSEMTVCLEVCNCLAILSTGSPRANALMIG